MYPSVSIITSLCKCALSTWQSSVSTKRVSFVSQAHRERFQDIAGRIDAAKWIKEYLSEFNKLATKGEMIVVARPLNARVIQIQELFSIKEDNILNVTIPKVRIVARGEVYTDPVYAPVANMVALRLFVVLSLNFGTYFRQLNITAAFLRPCQGADLYRVTSGTSTESG